MHQLVRETEEDGKATISFFNLSCDIDPVYVKYNKNILKCSHIEKEFQSLAMITNTSACCMKVYGSEKDTNENWLKCAMYLQWFQELCSIHRLDTNNYRTDFNPPFFISWKELLESLSDFFVRILQVGHAVKLLNQL